MGEEDRYHLPKEYIGWSRKYPNDRIGGRIFEEGELERWYIRWNGGGQESYLLYNSPAPFRALRKHQRPGEDYPRSYRGEDASHYQEDAEGEQPNNDGP